MEIACDMHKAMPEVQVGTFLVRQGFIEEHHLEAVLIGQKLLRAGAISVVQFQLAMAISDSDRVEITEALISKGFISGSEVEAALTPVPPSLEPPPLVLQIREIAVKASGETPAPSQSPAWNDQLDWGPPEPASPAQTPQPANPPPPAKNTLGGLLSGSQTLPTGLDKKSAGPKWTDQLDWTPPQADAPAAGEGVPNLVEPALARDGVDAGNTGGQEAPRIQLSNAVPDWKDQLDWSSSDSQSEGDSDARTAAEPKAVPPTESILAYSHMAQAFNLEAEPPVPPPPVPMSGVEAAAASGLAAHELASTDQSAAVPAEAGAAELPVDEDVEDFGSEPDETRTGENAAFEDEDSEPGDQTADSQKDAAKKDKRKKAKEKRKRRR